MYNLSIELKKKPKKTHKYEILIYFEVKEQVETNNISTWHIL